MQNKTFKRWATYVLIIGFLHIVLSLINLVHTGTDIESHKYWLLLGWVQAGFAMVTLAILNSGKKDDI